MFDAELFADRRKRLMALMRPDSIAIIPTAPTAVYSRDTDYRYRPDSDFHFLPGFLENIDAVYHFPGKYLHYDRKLLKAWQEVRMKRYREGILVPHELIDLGYVIHEMRLVKTAADIE